MTDPNHLLTDAGSSGFMNAFDEVFAVPPERLRPDPKPTLTTGTKYDAGKPRMDLLDAYAIEELAKVLTFGATKYEEHNWRKGIKVGRLIAAALRHLFSLLKGETNDPETGLSHAAHAMCCCMFLVWILKHKPEMDDRV